jgi:hypothetical protein
VALHQTQVLNSKQSAKRKEPTEREKIFANHIADEGLTSKMSLNNSDFE